VSQQLVNDELLSRCTSGCCAQISASTRGGILGSPGIAQYGSARTDLRIITTAPLLHDMRTTTQFTHCQDPIPQYQPDAWDAGLNWADNSDGIDWGEPPKTPQRETHCEPVKR
jgi:hypothetical protein